MKNRYLLLSIICSLGLIMGCGGEQKTPVKERTEKAAPATTAETVPESPAEASPKTTAAHKTEDKAGAGVKIETIKTPAKAKKVKEAEVKGSTKVAHSLAQQPCAAAPIIKTALKTAAKTVPTAAPAVSKQSITLGASIFKSRCVACHGTGGNGSTMAPAFVGNEWVKNSDAQSISAVIKKGRSAGAKKYKQFPITMPAHKSMPDKEIKALVDFLKSIN